MNTHAIALALRAAAENLERACQLARDLPPRAVGDVEAMALHFDAPKVASALFAVAGTLDPEGVAEGDEMVGELFDTLPVRRAV